MKLSLGQCVCQNFVCLELVLLWVCICPTSFVSEPLVCINERIEMISPLIPFAVSMFGIYFYRLLDYSHLYFEHYVLEPLTNDIRIP